MLPFRSCSMSTLCGQRAEPTVPQQGGSNGSSVVAARVPGSSRLRLALRHEHDRVRARNAPGHGAHHRQRPRPDGDPRPLHRQGYLPPRAVGLQQAPPLATRPGTSQAGLTSHRSGLFHLYQNHVPTIRATILATIGIIYCNQYHSQKVLFVF